MGVCLLLLLLLSGCSREQQDWRSAESSDTIDSYGQFIQRHPESELVTQARARVAQLGEDRDWQRAGSADTVDAYREFITQHPNGKWAQEAHIRIENFSLGEQRGTDAASKVTTVAGPAGAGPRAPAGAGARAAAGVGSATARSSAANGAGSNGATSALATNGTTGSANGDASNGSALPDSAADATPPGGAAFKLSPARLASASTTPARSYGLAQPGDAAAPAGSSALRGPPTTGPSAPVVRSASGTGSSTAASAHATPGGNGATTSSSASAAGASSASSGSGSATAVAHQPIAGGSVTAPGSKANGYGIQLGAFTSEASASAQWRTLSAKYASQMQGLQERVVAADTASGRIYRLQAVVGDEGRARAICNQLQVYGQACVAVLPH